MTRRTAAPATLAACAAAVLVAGCGASKDTYKVLGPTMEPTLRCARGSAESLAVACTAEKEDRIVVKPVDGPLHRSDIVMFKVSDAAAKQCGATGEGKTVLRVIGLPGERVVYAGARGGLVVDGRLVPEPYVAAGHRGGKVGAWTVGANAYFLSGDARDRSCDSRYFGPVERDAVIGKVTKILHGS